MKDHVYQRHIVLFSQCPDLDEIYQGSYLFLDCRKSYKIIKFLKELVKLATRIEYTRIGPVAEHLLHGGRFAVADRFYAYPCLKDLFPALIDTAQALLFGRRNLFRAVCINIDGIYRLLIKDIFLFENILFLKNIIFWLFIIFIFRRIFPVDLVRIRPHDMFCSRCILPGPFRGCLGRTYKHHDLFVFFEAVPAFAEVFGRMFKIIRAELLEKCISHLLSSRNYPYCPEILRSLNNNP